MKNPLLIVLLSVAQLLLFKEGTTQNIAINGTGNLPDTSAMLDISSTNKGFLAPRMTTTQQNAIPLPANGLLIFNTTDNVFKVNTGTTVSPVWTSLAGGSSATTNLLSSSANTITSTVNGVAANAPTVNTNALSLSGTNLTSTVNGIASSALNLAPAFGSSVWSLTGNAGITQPAVPVTYGTSVLAASEHFLGTTDAKDLVLGTKDLERMRILNTNGYIGIGTSAPTKPIDLVSNLAGAGMMKIQNTSATGYSSIDFFNQSVQVGNVGFSNSGASYPNAFYFATNTTNSMVFATKDIERMRINGTDGNVGIGTTTPLSSFEVNGAVATKLTKVGNGSTVPLDNTAAVWYCTGNADVSLPGAGTCTNRRYIIVNRTASAKTVLACTSLTGAANTSITANTSVEVISDGTNWLQIR